MNAEDSPGKYRSELCRRNFIKLAVGTIGLGFGVSVFKGGYSFARDTSEDEAHRLLMQGAREFKGVKIPEITPNDMFFLTQYDSSPDISPAGWSLSIEGMVEKPTVLTMANLTGMTDKTEAVTLACIENPVGGDLIGNAVWEGISLKKILDLAGPRAGIRKVVFYGAEGYSDSIPFEMATAGNVFLAYKMNGEPLPKEHGFPLRAIVPGIFGMKNVKWLKKIELVDFDFKGCWEKEGWSDTAEMLTLSQILMPTAGKPIPAGTYVIGGIACAGARGIRLVEVSMDDGNTWYPAELKPPLSPFAWTVWRYEWKDAGKGKYVLRVRATDGAGNLQESGSLLSDSYPSGARGIHEVKISVI